jgi:hypothetical protein
MEKMRNHNNIKTPIKNDIDSKKRTNKIDLKKAKITKKPSNGSQRK